MIVAFVSALVAALGVGYFVNAALAASKPPAPTILTSPTNPSTSSSAAFTFSDSQGGVTFKCSRDNAAFTACTSGVSYSGLALGSHSFQVEALSGTTASNVTSFSWSIVVPTPTILTGPTNPTTSTSAAFTFSVSQSGLTFKCSRDGASFTTCVSGVSYSGLAEGSHTFKVEAFSGSVASAAATYSWSIVPPTPTILSGPASPTTATTAKFTFSDSLGGVTFKCSRDGATFATCTSGVTYSGLADGSHTFAVEAASGSATSAAAQSTWTVDTTGPTVTVTFPSGGHTYGTGTWNAGCSGGPGICGTASDPSGVALVRVGVLSLNTLRYWNGTSFGSSGQFLLNATGTTSWRLPLPVPPTGTYAVLASATDSLGNVRQVAQLFVFSTSLTPPPAPVITSGPASSTSSTAATFKWTDSQSGVTFACSLDGGTAVACTSPFSYSGLTAAAHTFSVVAIDSFGNASSPATYHWTVTPTLTATTIVVQSGSPQFTGVSSAFGAPLVAKVTGTGNVPVPGVQVTFAAPSSGASGSFASCAGGNPHSYSCVVTTDVNGLATASTFTANGTSGGYTVTATASGVATPASFSLINSASFTIAGDITPLLYPGTSQPVNLTFTNPNPTAITIPASPAVGSVAITITTNKPLCAGSPTNFSMTQGLLVPVTIPGNTTTPVSLSTLLVPPADWPVVSMIETHVNQDACQSASLTLHYTGTATG